MKSESFGWERANVALLRPEAAGLGPLETAPAYPGHSLRDGVTFRFRGGIQRALTRILDWEKQAGRG